MPKNIANALFLVAILCGSGSQAFAGWGKFTLTSGSGEEVVVKHGLLGHKFAVQDRLGDGFATSHSILGTKSGEVSVLGNGVRYHKGLLGFSSAEAHSMLGDSLTTHKNILFRNTNVNMGGIGSLFGGHNLHSQGQTSPPGLGPAPEPGPPAAGSMPRIDPADFGGPPAPNNP